MVKERCCSSKRVRRKDDSYISKMNKEKTSMKTAMLRLFALMTLATSMSCFAATDDSKHDSSQNASASAKQEKCADSGKAKKQKQSKKTQGDDQDERDYDRALLGIYG
jgi:hypothetical protein